MLDGLPDHISHAVFFGNLVVRFGKIPSVVSMTQKLHRRLGPKLS
jgi:hypothetical protein